MTPEHAKGWTAFFRLIWLQHVKSGRIVYVHGIRHEWCIKAAQSSPDMPFRWGEFRKLCTGSYYGGKPYKRWKKLTYAGAHRAARRDTHAFCPQDDGRLAPPTVRAAAQQRATLADSSSKSSSSLSDATSSACTSTTASSSYPSSSSSVIRTRGIGEGGASSSSSPFARDPPRPTHRNPSPRGVVFCPQFCSSGG